MGDRVFCVAAQDVEPESFAARCVTFSMSILRVLGRVQAHRRGAPCHAWTPRRSDPDLPGTKAIWRWIWHFDRFLCLCFYCAQFFWEQTQERIDSPKNKLASRYLKKLSKQMVKVSWIFGLSMQLPASQAAQIVRATSKSDRRSVFVEKTSLSLWVPMGIEDTLN